MHPFFKSVGNFLLYILITIVFVSAAIGMM
jgi:hypothetical protein